MKKIIRLTESDIHNIVKETVQRIIAENEINEGVGDYFGAIRRGWNTGALTYGNELTNTTGALRALKPSTNRYLRNKMNAERELGLKGYNTEFEKDVKNWLRGHTVNFTGSGAYGMGPETREYWRKVKAKADEIKNNHSEEDIINGIGHYDWHVD